MPKALVVHPEAETSARLAAQFQELGHDIETVDSASKAIDTCRRRSFDIIVTDHPTARKIYEIEFADHGGLQGLPRTVMITGRTPTADLARMFALLA